MYKLRTKTVEDGGLILRAGDFIKSTIIIEAGQVEVFSIFEGHEFKLDNLYRGSIINQLAMMNIDKSVVNIRAVGFCKISLLDSSLL